MSSVLVTRPSAWKFTTSSTGGVGVEFVAVEGGKIFLENPKGDTVTFCYGAAGVGIAAGIKLPKIGKIQINAKGKAVGGAIAPAAFPNGGKLYLLDSFAGSELTTTDIQGVCAFLEISGGIIAGVSATAMLVGMNPIWLAGLGASLGVSSGFDLPG